MPDNRYLPLSIIQPSWLDESMFHVILLSINSSDYSSVSYRSMMYEGGLTINSDIVKL